MQPIIKCILLKNDIVLISEINEIPSELGEPDCQLIKPFKLNKQSNDDYTLETWVDFTNQNEIMIHSDSILTLVDPTLKLRNTYLDLIK